MKITLSRSTTTILSMALAALIGIAGYQVPKKVETKIQALPVDTVPPADPGQDEQKSQVLANLYPLLVHGNGTAALSASTGPVDLDPLFRSAEQQVERQQIDWYAVVSAMARLDATLDEGAILNGKYVALGKPVAWLAYVNNKGRQVVPVLHEVAPQGVVLKVEGRPLPLPLKVRSR